MGCEAAIWLDLTELLKVALASLQKRTFAPFELTNANPEDNAADSFSTLYEGLMKDLTRLKHVICIGRTILSAGEKAQNLAVEAMVDHEVFRLINLSVKVTARGYDGTTSRSESQKWQTVVDACE